MECKNNDVRRTDVVPPLRASRVDESSVYVCP